MQTLRLHVTCWDSWHARRIALARERTLVGRLALIILCFVLSACVAEVGVGSELGVASDDGGTRRADSGWDAGNDRPDPPPVDTAVTPRYTEVANRFDAERLDLGAPGAALILLEDGEVSFAHGFGNKGPEGSPAVTSQTLFRVGSLTKVLTAIVLLQLIDQGAARLDDPISMHLGDFSLVSDATAAGKITLRHLLTHRSGLSHQYRFEELEIGDAALSSGLIGSFAQQGYLMSPPGRIYNYSNNNFALAGLVIERLTGSPYRVAMDERLFRPLGMSRTTLRGSIAERDGDYAQAVTNWPSGTRRWVGPASYDGAWSGPSGFAISSVRDFGNLLRFFDRGSPNVLRQETLQALLSPQVNKETFYGFYQYGFGLNVHDGFASSDGYHAVRLVEHDGSVPGYSAQLFWIPSLRFGMVTLASADGAYFPDTFDLAVRTLTNIQVAPIPQLPQAPSTADYAGAFFDPHTIGRMTVTVTANEIVMSLPDLEMLGIRYVPTLTPNGSPDNFTGEIDGTPMTFTFIRDASGKVEYIRELGFVAKRMMGN